jgi:hypothetical protein
MMFDNVILFSIFKYLSHIEIHNVMKVCKYWNISANKYLNMNVESKEYHFSTKIKFKYDWNGRPRLFLKKGGLILVQTHPFYLGIDEDSPNYCRAYEFNVFDVHKLSHHCVPENYFHAYFKDYYKIVFNFEKILDKLNSSAIKFELGESRFTLSNHTYKEILSQFKGTYNITGIINYKNRNWIVRSDSGESGESDESDESDEYSMGEEDLGGIFSEKYNNKTGNISFDFCCPMCLSKNACTLIENKKKYVI